MPLTAAERADIRYFMGWPARFFQTSSLLEQAMSALDGQPESLVLVQAAVTACKDIDTKLIDAHGRLKAMKVGSIDLPGNREISSLRDEGRRWVGRLSATLGCPIMQDVFSGAAINPSNYAMHG